MQVWPDAKFTQMHFFIVVVAKKAKDSLAEEKT